MEKLGPNDLYAWQIFGTQNPIEITGIYFGLSILLGHEPESNKIFQIINEAHQAAMKPMGLYKIIKNSKPIFDKYIKPVLAKIKVNVNIKPEQEIPRSYGPQIPEANDLLAWEIFQTRDPNEIKKIYFKLARQFHPDRYKGPEAEAIFKIISDAYTSLKEYLSSNEPTDLYKVVPNSKKIFYQYIKPFLDLLKIEPKLKELTTIVDQIEENFSVLKLTPIIALTNIIPTINKLEKLIKEINLLKPKITEINKAAPKEAQKIENQLNIIKKEAADKIKQLQPAITVEKAFLYVQYLEELLEGNPEIKKEIKSLAQVIIQPSAHAEPIKGAQYKSLIQELRKMGAITDEGEIKSLEKTYKSILKYLIGLKQMDYFKQDNPQAKSLLKEIENKELFYNNKLKEILIQPFLELAITLESLATLKK